MFPRSWRCWLQNSAALTPVNFTFLFSSVLSFWVHQCHNIPSFCDNMFYPLNGIDCSAGPLNLKPKGNSLPPAAILFCKVRICRDCCFWFVTTKKQRQLADLCQPCSFYFTFRSLKNPTVLYSFWRLFLHKKAFLMVDFLYTTLAACFLDEGQNRTQAGLEKQGQ